MNGKQNLIFFIGLTLIIMVFWANGYWSILKSGLTGSSSSSGTPPEQGTNAKNGKCPQGYTYVGNGKCLPLLSSLPPAPM